MISQKQLIHKNDWDVLIILDACRFDIFKEVNYLDGNLKKVKSRGSNTGEWLVNTFPKRYDIEYYSANPYINSIGLSLARMNETYANQGYNWKAVDHFSKIVDIWDDYWDNEFGSVPPKDVNKSFFSNPPKKSSIVHYIQPHAPYLSFSNNSPFAGGLKGRIDGNSENIEANFVTKAKGFFGPILEEFLGKKGLWRLKKKLSIEVNSAEEAGWRRGDIYYHYRKNLESVLHAIENLLQKFQNKKIAITADHGEAFGKKGIWGHPVETSLSCLREIPWLEVEV